MNTGIIQILPHINKEHNNLIPRPSVSPRKRRHGQRLQSVRRIMMIPRSQLFMLLISRPRIGRPLESFVDDIDKTDFLHNSFDLVELDRRTPELSKGLPEEVTPFGEGVIRGKSPVVGENYTSSLLKLNITTRLDIATQVSLMEESGG